MKDYTLSKEKIAELEKLHRSLRDKRQADRVKAVIALSKGWSAAQGLAYFGARVIGEWLAVGPGRVKVAIAGPAGIPGVSATIVTVATGEEKARQAGRSWKRAIRRNRGFPGNPLSIGRQCAIRFPGRHT